MPKFKVLSGKHQVLTPGKDKARGTVITLAVGAEFDDPRDLDKIFKNKFGRLEAVKPVAPEKTPAEIEAEAKAAAEAEAAKGKGKK